MTDNVPPQDLELYRPKPVNTNVIYRMATDYQRLHERCRQLRNAQIMQAQQWASAQNMMAKASKVMPAGQRPHIHFGDPYSAIAKAGTKKLEILVQFFLTHDTLTARMPFIHASIIRSVGLDIKKYGTQADIAQEIVNHTRKTIDMLERLGRFMPANKLRQAQEKNPFSLDTVRLMLAQRQVYVDVGGMGVATSGHVSNGVITQNKSGQIIPFNKP